MAARVIVGTENVLREAGGPPEVPEGADGRKGGRLWVCFEAWSVREREDHKCIQEAQKEQRTVHVATLMDIQRFRSTKAGLYSEVT